jgi:VIT1/CCC1 family predicted Fe2+/Mn2+ transporter
MAKSSDNVKAILLSQLRNELTEAAIYERLSKMEKDSGNREILERISADEMSHAKLIAAIVSENVKPCSFKIHWTVFCARVLGLTFVLRLMEKGEHNAGGTYRTIIDAYPQLSLIAEDEDRHEAELIGMLNDERLNNMGSIVLGLNDALVELTGALAGFTFALGSPAKIAKLGLITGFAAAMSMAASAFLSARADAQAGGEKSSEGEGNGALRSALYTGIAYVVTVFLLTAPYALLPSATVALAVMLLVALSIIAFFNFYLSVARDVSFKRGFFVMAGISTFVALVSYGFGYLLR